MSHRPSHTRTLSREPATTVALRRDGASGIRGAKKDKTAALSERAAAESSLFSWLPGPDDTDPPGRSATLASATPRSSRRH